MDETQAEDAEAAGILQQLDQKIEAVPKIWEQLFWTTSNLFLVPFPEGCKRGEYKDFYSGLKGACLCKFHKKAIPVINHIGIEFWLQENLREFPDWRNFLYFKKAKPTIQKIEVENVETAAKNITCISISKNGNSVAYGFEDGEIQIWKLQENPLLHEFKAHKSAITTISLVQDYDQDGGDYFLISNDQENILKVWNIKEKKSDPLYEEPNSIASLSTLSKRLVLVNYAKKTVTIQDTKTKTIIQTLNVAANEIQNIWINAVGDKVILAYANNTIKIWSDSEDRPFELGKHGAKINTVAFSNDGKYIVSGSDDKSVKIWNVAEKKEHTSLDKHTGAINSVSFSTDGTLLISGSDDETIKIWNVENGELLKNIRGNSAVTKASFTNNSEVFFVAKSNNKFSLWKVVNFVESFVQIAVGTNKKEAWTFHVHTLCKSACTKAKGSTLLILQSARKFLSYLPTKFDKYSIQFKLEIVDFGLLNVYNKIGFSLKEAVENPTNGTNQFDELTNKVLLNKTNNTFKKFIINKIKPDMEKKRKEKIEAENIISYYDFQIFGRPYLQLNRTNKIKFTNKRKDFYKKKTPFSEDNFFEEVWEKDLTFWEMVQTEFHLNFGTFPSKELLIYSVLSCIFQPDYPKINFKLYFESFGDESTKKEDLFWKLKEAGVLLVDDKDEAQEGKGDQLVMKTQVFPTKKDFELHCLQLTLRSSYFERKHPLGKDSSYRRKFLFSLLTGQKGRTSLIDSHK